MDKDKLDKANKLQEEIGKLDSFINTASKVWSGKLTIKDKIMSFISNSYGIISSKELEMNTKLKNRVLKVVIDYKEELENEFNNI